MSTSAAQESWQSLCELTAKITDTDFEHQWTNDQKEALHDLCTYTDPHCNPAAADTVERLTNDISSILHDCTLDSIVTLEKYLDDFNQRKDQRAERRSYSDLRNRFNIVRSTAVLTAHELSALEKYISSMSPDITIWGDGTRSDYALWKRRLDPVFKERTKSGRDRAAGALKQAIQSLT